MPEVKTGAPHNLPGSPGLFVKPKPVKSGQPFKERVVVSHRSDNLLTEQIENVKNVQEALKEALSELEKAKSADEVKFLQNQVGELKKKSDQMVIVLKIVNKINIELAHARAELAKTVREGDSEEINRARKRVGWLEDRMEHVLGKKRQRSAHRPASLIDDPRNMMTAGQTNERGYMSDYSSLARSRPDGGGPGLVGLHSGMSSSFGESPMHRAGFNSQLSFKLPPKVEDVQAGIHEDESKPVTRHQRKKKKKRDTSISEDEDGHKSENEDISNRYMQEKTFLTQYPHSPHSERDLTTPDMPSTASPQKQTRERGRQDRDVDSPIRSPTTADIKQDSLSPLEPLPPITKSDDASSEDRKDSENEATSDSDRAPNKQAFLTQSDESTSKDDSKSEGEDEMVNLEEMPPLNLEEQVGQEEIDAADAYWQSEHHRFEYSEFVDCIVGENPTSYHGMGLAKPGTFVFTPPDTESRLPWRSREERSGSEISDVHKVALDKLSMKVHKMYGKVKDASMVSVRHELNKPEKGGGPTLIQQLERMRTQATMASCGLSANLEMNYIKMLSSSSNLFHEDTQHSLQKPVTDRVEAPSERQNVKKDKPTLARFGLNRPDSQASDCDFPKIDPQAERLGTSLSGRIVYRPNPLPYPDKLPLTKVNKSAEYPPLSKDFSKSRPGVVEAAERIVDQRNLYNETKFTSSLFKSRVKRQLGDDKEQEAALRKAAGSRKSGKSRSSKSSKSSVSAQSDDTINTQGVLQKTFSTVRAAVKFKAGKWKEMKPKSGALKHTGMKWERVKSIVHNNLISPNTEERLDAARHLGNLRVGDTMVLYALRERLKNDEEPRVAYESAKSLASLGAWDEDVMEVFLHYFLNGNTHIRADLLKTIIFSKNVQFMDRSVKGFEELALILSTMCKTSEEADDQMSFNAAVCIGRLCLPDENAKYRLKKVIDCSSNSHMKAEALDILIRQMNYNSPDVVPVVLEQLSKSAVWKYRVDAAKLLVHLGIRYVMPSDALAEQVYEQLERRLWDEPNKVVRHEAAKALAALELFPQACERVEKKLDDPDESNRSQAVISAGTLGMKNERILRHLLEMIDLDSSEYVRLMIIRAFATLNCCDKRVLRILRDKEKGDGPLARESVRTLEHLDAFAQILEMKRKRRARKQAMLLASVA